MGSRTSTESALFEHLRSRQFLCMIPRAVSLQLMHPAISAGILEHSPSPGYIWLHKRDSVSATIEMAFAPNPEQWVPDRILLTHEKIKGTDAAGHRYHSLTPEVFHFQHAAYVETLMETVTRFRGPMSPDERAALYDRCRRWYRIYGISTVPVPETVEEFDTYFREVTSQLTTTPALTRYRSQVLRPRHWWPATVPTGAIRAFLHPAAARALGVRASAADRVVASAFTSVAPLR